MSSSRNLTAKFTSTREQASTSIHVDTASDSYSWSDERNKREKSSSPMSITPKSMGGDMDKKQSHITMELDIKNRTAERLSAQLKNLEMQLKNSKEQINNSTKEIKSLKKKLSDRKELIQGEEAHGRSVIEDRRSVLRSEEEELKMMEVHFKNLWGVIQTQDDANFKMWLDAQKWRDREKEMLIDLGNLRKALENSKRNVLDKYFSVSPNTNDWKLTMEFELNHQFMSWPTVNLEWQTPQRNCYNMNED